jgi:adenylate cyclase
LRIEDGTATLSVKAMTPGTCREEYEYAVPPAEALEMLGSLCGGPRVAKTRHRVPCGDHVFEVDEFGGDNAGLVVAEIELSDPGEPFGRPAWLGEEVTDHLRYYNFRLAERPFGSWPAADRQAAAAGRHLQAAGGEEP